MKKDALVEGKKTFRDWLTFAFPEPAEIGVVEDAVQDLVWKGRESINLRKRGR